MASYAQKDYPEIDPDKVSLVVAFSNLLQRFGTDLDPTQLNIILTQDDPVIDWWTIAAYMGSLELDEKSDDGWPTTNNAIIKFTRMDISAAGPVDHYCLVADQRAHSIIDSLDGQIKSASIYGYPQGWASYTSIDDLTSEEELDDPHLQTSESKPGTTYTVLRGGESGWHIARKLNIPATDLKEHNDLADFDHIPSGTVLHLPIARAFAETRNITYQILDAPLIMHVTKEDGARKWSFGNAKTFKDIQVSGPTYPLDTNITVLAIAEVPLTDEGEEITAAYYLDGLALGNFKQTGRVQYTVGFNHSHLAEGFVERVAAPPKPEIQAKLDEAEIALTAAPEPPEEPEPVAVPDDWKLTYKPFNSTTWEPEVYVAVETCVVHDYDGVKPDRDLARGKGVKISGTFVKDGVEIARPFGVTTWYGIELDKLSPEDDPELYNYGVPLADRVLIKNGHLSPIERYWYVPFAKAVSRYARVTGILKNKQPKE